MNEILIVLIAIIKTLIFFIGGIIGIGLILLGIQLISYKVFKFNIYKNLIKIFFVR